MSETESERRANPEENLSVHDSTVRWLAHQMGAFIERIDGKDASLGEIFSCLSGRSHAVLMVLLSFPLCLPVGIPVLTTALGLTLAFVGFSLALGQEPWLPGRLQRKVIPNQKLLRIIERLLRATERIDRWLRPRLLMLTTRKMIRIHGGFVLIMALVAAVPVSLPLNNMVAALPIMLMGLSLLQRDGMFVIVSYASAIPCVAYYGYLTFLLREGFQCLTGV